MKTRFPTTACLSSTILARVALSLSIGLVAAPSHALTISIANTDGDGEGFNDPTPATPVAGNPGTTLGAQRLYLFQYAADFWGVHLDEDVPIVISASLDNLGGDEFGAILGGARPTSVHRDFEGTPRARTWYVAGLANQRHGSDLNDLVPETCSISLFNGGCPEVEIVFNSAVDDSFVLGEVDFYYGLDGNSGGDIDFLSVVLHEMGHGLGFLGLIDPNTGAKYFDHDDAFILHLDDPNINPRLIHEQTDTQRTRAIVDDGALVWIGPGVKNVSGDLVEGVRPDGAVEMYAPSFYQSGSSVSHFNTDVFPHQLMEPFATDPPAHDITMTRALFEDIGWQTRQAPDCGDATDDGNISSADALAVLRGAVALGYCPAYVCDVNYAGGVTSADALVVLNRAVGQNVALNCPRGRVTDINDSPE